MAAIDNPKSIRARIIGVLRPACLGSVALLGAVLMLIFGTSAAIASTYGPPVTIPGTVGIHPAGVAVDGAGDVFFANYGYNEVQEVPGGVGPVQTLWNDNPDGNRYALLGPIAADAAGDVFFPPSDVSDGSFELGEEPVGDTSSGWNGPVYLGGFDDLFGFHPTDFVPVGLAADAAGDVFVADFDSGRGAANYVRVLELPASTSTGPAGCVWTAGSVATLPTCVYSPGSELGLVPAEKVVGTGFQLSTYSVGLAVDDQGDVFVAGTPDTVVELPAGGGPQVPVASGFNGATSLAVDSLGDLFVDDSGNNRVVEVPAAGGPEVTVASGLDDPQGIAVDSKGDLFIAEFGSQTSQSGAVIELPLVRGGTVTSSAVEDPSSGGAWSGTEVAGASASDTVTVKGVGTNTPSGSVIYSLYDNAGCSGTAAVTQQVSLGAGGSVPASSPTSRLVAGSYSYQASYSGDGHFLGSTSACEPFSVKPAQQTVYIGNAGTTVTGYPASAPGNVSPAGPLAQSGNVGSLAFDASGDLWVGSGAGPEATSGTLSEYTPAQLASGGSAAPALQISSSVGVNTGAAFDAHGDLWVVCQGSDSISEFTPAQLRSAATTTPAVTITGVGHQPNGIAISPSGDVWVSSYDDDSLLEYTSGQLHASGSPLPAVVISADGAGSVSGPARLQFDAHGDLWVANNAGDTVVEYRPDQLSSSGSPAPAVTVSSSAGSLAGANGLGFDADGNLWVAAAGSNALVEFSAAQITASGAPTPTDTITGSATQINNPWVLAVGPSPGPWLGARASAQGATTTTATIRGVAGQLLVALVSGDGPARLAQHSIVFSTPALSWTRASQADTQPGDAEVWYATVPSATRAVHVTTTLARPGSYTETLVVQALVNASGIGAANGASGDDGLPTVSLTNTQAGSRLLAAGEDPSAARAVTPGAGQGLLHRSTDASPATHWAQDFIAPTPSDGLTQTFTDARLGTPGSLDHWNIAAVEVR
jgi:sugar lactone lactonase YvrE